MIVRTLITTLGLLWLFFEIGQFFQQFLPIGKNSLFWPLWGSVALVIILGAHALDNFRDRNSQE